MGKIILDPEDKAFIRNRRIYLRSVNGMSVYKKNIPGLQIVGLSFNVIGSLSGKKDDHLVKIMIMVGKFPLGLVLDVKKPEKLSFLSGGDRLELGGRTLEVIETPGHTRGCICFLDRENQYLFAGDTGCNREILVYFDHSGTVKDVMESDEKLLALKDQYKEIWPGHHECPMDASIIEDYRQATETILKNPGIGEKISLDSGYKILYNYKTIGVSYTESHIS